MYIRTLIQEIVSSMGADPSLVEVEIPKDEKNGDRSTPVAMTLAKVLRSSPRNIAEAIVNKMGSHQMFEKVEVAGPGFINFFFSMKYLFDELNEILMDPDKAFSSDIGTGKRIQVEFVSANPTGPLHLGHGRGAAVGGALSNLLSRAGYNVEKEFYVNDAGRQVKLLGESIFARYKESFRGDYPFPEDGYRGEYVRELAAMMKNEVGQIYSAEEFPDAQDECVRFGVRQMIESIKGDLDTFGVHFDRWQSEKALYEEGNVENCIKELREKGLLYEKDGALWFRASDFGDEKDRVVIKSDGSHTYFASDIAYHWLKIHRGFDELVNIWGADHHGYIPRIRAVMNALEQPADRLSVVLVQMVTLLRGGKPVQMSKRSGEFVTLKEVIEEVGADTTKFIFLTRRSDSHLEFDIETAKKESSENPVFYVQYAFARINSIFRKAEEEGVQAQEAADLSCLKEPEEIMLIKKMMQYRLVLEGAVKSHEPHRITYFLRELAGQFHPYYNMHRVIVPDMSLSVARLALCRAVKAVLADGLSILGVSAPRKM